MDLFRKKSVDQLVSESTPLKRTLKTFDLTMLGIGAIIGTGIFVLTGKAPSPQVRHCASPSSWPRSAAVSQDCAMQSSQQWHQCPVPHIRTRIWRSAS